jgi:hypothetical protein
VAHQAKFSTQNLASVELLQAQHYHFGGIKWNEEKKWSKKKSSSLNLIRNAVQIVSNSDRVVLLSWVTDSQYQETSSTNRNQFW